MSSTSTRQKPPTGRTVAPRIATETGCPDLTSGTSQASAGRGEKAPDDRDAHRRPRPDRKDPVPSFSHISPERRSHDHCSLLSRTAGPRLDRGEYPPQPEPARGAIAF